MFKLSLNLCFSAYFYIPWNYDDVVLLLWYYTLLNLIDYFDSHFLIIISCLTSSIGLMSAIFHRRLFYSIISFYELLHWDNYGLDYSLIVIILDLTWLDLMWFDFIWLYIMWYYARWCDMCMQVFMMTHMDHVEVSLHNITNISLID